MQLVWVNTATGDEQRKTIHGRLVFLRLTKDEIRVSSAPTGLRIEIEGQNVFVLDTSDGRPVAIAGIEVEKGRRRAWGRDQELRIGANVVLWVADPATLRAHTPASPELQRRVVVVIGTLILLMSLFGVLLYRVTTAQNLVESRVTPAPTATLMPTGTLTPIVTLTPTPTLIATPTLTPTTVPATVVSPLHAPASPTPNPPPPPTVSIASPARPEQWDERLNSLGVNFDPAIVPVGGEFWRLVEATWLDERQSTGRHHIFVDVVDAQQKRIQDREVRIRVSSVGANAACTPAIDQNIQRPFGADCPMFSSGFAYTVVVDGLPSDRVEGLGLGTIEDRFAPIPTSFILRFRLERRMSN